MNLKTSKTYSQRSTETCAPKHSQTPKSRLLLELQNETLNPHLLQNSTRKTNNDSAISCKEWAQQSPCNRTLKLFRTQILVFIEGMVYIASIPRTKPNTYTHQYSKGGVYLHSPKRQHKPYFIEIPRFPSSDLLSPKTKSIAQIMYRVALQRTYFLHGAYTQTLTPTDTWTPKVCRRIAFYRFWAIILPTFGGLGNTQKHLCGGCC